MDLDHPGIMMSGMLIGTLGLGLFLYGRKTPDLRCLAVGVILSVLPLIAHSYLSLWGVTAACIAGLVAAHRLG